MSVGKVLFMGTPDFAVPILKALVTEGYEVSAVITQPDKPVGRKQILTPPPVKIEAQRLNIPVLQPKRVREEDALKTIAALQPDVVVTAAYGQLLPQALLDIPKVGCLNVHASLLPRWRGAAPIHRAIMAGDETSGVTIMEMVLELDAGPVLGQQSVAIEPEDNVGTLHDKLAAVGARLLLELLPDYVSGKRAVVHQPTAGVTYANRILPEDEHIDWTLPAVRVHNQIRGLSPWPGARSEWRGQVFKVWETESESIADAPTGGYVPGTVYEWDGRVLVQCGDRPLQLRVIQPAGKKPMSATDWFRGVPSQQVTLGKTVEC